MNENIEALLKNDSRKNVVERESIEYTSTKKLMRKLCDKLFFKGMLRHTFIFFAFFTLSLAKMWSKFAKTVGNGFLLARNSLQKSAREILASDFSAVFGMVLIRFTAEKYFCKAHLTTKSYGGKLIIVKCA